MDEIGELVIHHLGMFVFFPTLGVNHYMLFSLNAGYVGSATDSYSDPAVVISHLCEIRKCSNIV